MVRRKREKMLQNLGNLLAICNDCITKGDADTVSLLFGALATGIDKKNGVDKLIEYAKSAFMVRHPDYSAENSSSSIGGDDHGKDQENV